MIVSSLSPYATVAFAPAAESSPTVRKADEASKRPVAPLQPATADPDEEAALQERYFEEMISSAADLLLRSFMGGRATPSDP